MKRHIYTMLTITLSACGTKSSDVNERVVQENNINKTTNFQKANLVYIDKSKDSNNYNNATYFVVIADTSLSYAVLHTKMIVLSQKLSIPIDTMGRFFNNTKNLIALPDNDEDEVYAGDYYPRRFPSNNLSLEYLDFYQTKAGKKTIALVRGIYETEKIADRVLGVLQKSETKGFKIKANIFVGCLH